MSELSQGDHELWELYGFARLHYPDSNEEEITQIVAELVFLWLERDWLIATQSRKNPAELPSEQLLRSVKDLGETAANPQTGVILLRLTARAAADVEWLKS